MKTGQKFTLLFIISISFLLLTSTGCSKYDNKLNDELMGAAISKDIAKVKDLIAKKANPNAVDSDGNSVLMRTLTAMSFSLDDLMKGTVKGDQNSSETREIVQMLVRAGADVNFKNKDGDPILKAAFVRGDIAIINYLIAIGADVKVKESSGDPLILLAASTGDEDLIKKFVAKGADINATSKNGTSALLIAVSKNYYYPAVYLINKGANVNAKVNAGTPLSFACGNGNLELVKLLHEKGADVNVKDDKGNSPLKIAQMKKQEKIIEYLQKAGAKE